MNIILRGEMFLLMVAAALFSLAVLQFNGTVDVVTQINKYI